MLIASTVRYLELAGVAASRRALPLCTKLPCRRGQRWGCADPCIPPGSSSLISPAVHKNHGGGKQNFVVRKVQPYILKARARVKPESNLRLSSPDPLHSPLTLFTSTAKCACVQRDRGLSIQFIVIIRLIHYITMITAGITFTTFTTYSSLFTFITFSFTWTK